MSVEYIEGDLFDCGVAAIGHGVNCTGVMGAGIATVFRRRYPDMYVQYKLWCETGVLTPGISMPWEVVDPADPLDPVRYVFNIASQDRPGADARYQWLFSGVNNAIMQARSLGLSALALPRIGAGIGGLKWDDVRDAYEDLGKAYSSYRPSFKLVVVSLPGSE